MFIETPRFPDDIAYGARGIINYSTSVLKSVSGRHVANQNWDYPLHEYDVGFPVRSFDKLQILTNYFHVCGGQFGAFRFKDHKDYKSCPPLTEATHNDQALGSGNGVTTAFQLIKKYTVGIHTRNRVIQKPVPGLIQIGIGGVLQTSGYSINHTTGIVTFAAPPAVAAVLTWGGEFDVPVKFKQDQISSDIESFQLSGLQVEVEEIRL
ncbi:MAG: DUF2460 domain-containing protein [Saprospiraceae bacterium]|nr:DUF2460 domain-containing protein [Saprospiraceae bacterium]